MLTAQFISVGFRSAKRGNVQTFIGTPGKRLAKVISLSFKNNFENEVLNSDKTVLLDFWASWCAPCRMVVPIVEEIADERRDIKVGKINVDEEPELANKFSIMSIPTLVVMKNGMVLEYK